MLIWGVENAASISIEKIYLAETLGSCREQIRWQAVSVLLTPDSYRQSKVTATLGGFNFRPSSSTRPTWSTMQRYLCYVPSQISHPGFHSKEINSDGITHGDTTHSYVDSTRTGGRWKKRITLRYRKYRRIPRWGYNCIL